MTNLKRSFGSSKRSFCFFVALLMLSARVCGDSDHHQETHSSDPKATDVTSSAATAMANHGHMSKPAHGMHMTHAPSDSTGHNHNSDSSKPSRLTHDDSIDHGHHKNDSGNSMDHHGDSMDHHSDSSDHGGNSMDPGDSMDHGDHPTVDHTNSGHGDTHSGHNSGSGGHSMQMFFELSHSVVILFETWDVKSIGGLIGSCFGLFFVAALYEGLKWFRERLMSRAIKEAKGRAAAKAQALQTVNGNMKMPMTDSCTDDAAVTRVPFFDHIIQTVLHMLQVFMSYLLMLAFMTYNVWIGLAIMLGAGCGYFIFLSRLPQDAQVSDSSEH